MSANNKNSAAKPSSRNLRSRGRARTNTGNVNGPSRARPAPRTARDREAPALVPCVGCGLCCTYVAVEVDQPNTLKRATEILWFLYHERVSVFRDGDGEWYVQFETTCRHLTDDRSCRIYPHRPHTCREYEAAECEVNADDEGLYLKTAGEFLDYLRRYRKRIYAKVKDGFEPDAVRVESRHARRKRLPVFHTNLQRMRAMRSHTAP
ncbi:MAG: YkgJ family cysteine cluster protein [Proteobacteria bacterium]|nr:YkgJ family cysteine cluster protein [Pseudomonadota bacterium]